MALPTSNLWINVKASSFVTLNGSDEVTGWGDLTTGGTSHDLTAETGCEADFLATEPAVNGMPVVFKKSGKNSWLRTASFAVFPDTATDITLYMVIKSITSSSILDRYIDTGVDSLVVSGNSSFLKVTYKGQSIQINTDFTTYRLVRFTTSAAGSTLAVDSTLVNSNTLSQTPGLTSDRLSIFSSAVGANTGNKSFTEIALFTALHGGSDISDSESYFRTTYGLSTASLTTAVITFPTLPTGKHVGDANFSPGATSNSPATITYVSSNTAVATIVSGQIHIVGVGSANITASQASTTGYTAATDVTHSLTIANIITMANVNTSAFGNVVTLAISTNLTTPAYKNIVCSTGNIGVAGKTEGGATVVTRCGIARAPGRNSQTISFEGIHNTTISSTTEVSANELAALSTSKAQFLVRAQDEGTPANYYRQGQGFISDYSETAAVDGFITFTGTIDVIGDLDLTP